MASPKVDLSSEVKAEETDLDVRDSTVPGRIIKVDATPQIEKVESTLSVQDQIDMGDAAHRRAISKNVTDAFIKINLWMIGIIAAVFLIESLMIIFINKSYNRVVDTKTVMTLIGATTVQLGAITLNVSNWLFPKQKTDKP